MPSAPTTPMPHFARAWSSNWKGRPKEHPRGLIHGDALVRVPAWCVVARHFPSCIPWSHGTTRSAGRNALGHQSSQSPLHMAACVGSSTPPRPLGPHPELPEQLSLGPSWLSEHFKRHGFHRSIAQPEGTPADASPVPSREGMHGTGERHRTVQSIAKTSHTARKPRKSARCSSNSIMAGACSALRLPSPLPTPQRFARRFSRRLCRLGGIPNHRKASWQWVSSRPAGVRQRATDSIVSLFSSTRSETWRCRRRRSPASSRHAVAGGAGTDPSPCRQPRIPIRELPLGLREVTARLDSVRQLPGPARSICMVPTRHQTRPQQGHGEDQTAGAAEPSRRNALDPSVVHSRIVVERPAGQ